MGFSTKIRKQVHQKYGGLCAYCGHAITQYSHDEIRLMFYEGMSRTLAEVSKIRRWL